MELFRPVATGRASAQIVEQFKELIRDGRLSVGDRLPSERQLTEQFSVSRVTVRDALRNLEARGLVEIRLGAQGGAFVTAPGPRTVGEGITDMLVLSDLSAAEVTEARQVFELSLIPLVCERADEEDLAQLEEICQRSDAALADGKFRVELSAEFHVRLAQATHNAAVELMIDSLQGPMLTSLQEAKAVAPHMGERGSVEHRQIIEAIKKRDIEAAESVMRTHLERTARRLDVAPE